MGTIMAVIMTAHIRNIRPKSAAVHACQRTMAMPASMPPMEKARYTM